MTFKRRILTADARYLCGSWGSCIITLLEIIVLNSSCYLQEEAEELLKLQYWMDYVSIC